MVKQISYTELKKQGDKYTWQLYIYSKSGLPTDNEHHKFLNIERKVEKLQTNAIKFEGGSWLYFPKVNCIKIDKYLYNGNDLCLTITESGFNVLGYHLRKIN